MDYIQALAVRCRPFIEYGPHYNRLIDEELSDLLRFAEYRDVSQTDYFAHLLEMHLTTAERNMSK